MNDLGALGVLIVEDDYLVSREISRVLKICGYREVGIAANGKSAMEMVRQLRPDVVLMDIKMPDADGLELTRWIHQEFPTPVVILTAYESNDLLDKAGAMGAAAYLSKPPTAKEIEQAITIALARHKDLLELKRLNEALKNEIIEHRETEAQLKKTAREKELLLMEAHHRIKNNFSIVSSLLNIQSNLITDPVVKALLKQNQARIQIMARLHEAIYQSSSLIDVNMPRYLGNAMDDLEESYCITNTNITLKLDISDIDLLAKTATSIGLIVIELVTNAIKYAFPDKRSGRVLLTLVKDNGFCTLIVSDNGIGMPSEVVTGDTVSIGLELVRLLTTQMNATLDISRENGTTFTIRLPIN